MTIRGARVRTYLGEVPREDRDLEAIIDASGTTVPLDPALEFDRAVISIPADRLAGDIFGLGPAAALSEVEVLAQAVEGSPPAAIAVRGDADCSGNVNLSDAIATLAHLFRGNTRRDLSPPRGPLCCPAGADVNASQTLNITDPIHLLLVLFAGSVAMPPPFPECGRISEEVLACDGGVCPD